MSHNGRLASAKRYAALAASKSLTRCFTIWGLRLWLSRREFPQRAQKRLCVCQRRLSGSGQSSCSAGRMKGRAATVAKWLATFPNVVSWGKRRMSYFGVLVANSTPNVTEPG